LGLGFVAETHFLLCGYTSRLHPIVRRSVGFICDVSSNLGAIARIETNKTLGQSTIAAPESRRRISRKPGFETCNPKPIKKILCRMPRRRLFLHRRSPLPAEQNLLRVKERKHRPGSLIELDN
jgi:hypothetical protein